MPPKLLADSLRSEAQLFAQSSVPLAPGRDYSGDGDAGVKTLAERVARNAAIRNDFLERFLFRACAADVTHVLWIDADVFYPPTLVTDLLAVSDVDIVAPGVYLQGHYPRFYDLAGFVSGGKWAEMFPPYWEGKTDGVNQMDSVGTCYLVPATVYHKGARYAPSQDYAEHYSVCEFARREMGMKVLCDMRQMVWHAYLPEYGEVAH